MSESKSHKTTANRIAKKYNTDYNNGKGVDVKSQRATIIISIVLGSTFFIILGQTASDFVKWTGAILALISTILAGINAFINPKKIMEGHRNIANRYLNIAIGRFNRLYYAKQSQFAGCQDERKLIYCKGL